jgi:hypothetical protein
MNLSFEEGISFNKWKDLVDAYVRMIINEYPDKISIDLKKYYLLSDHPYKVAVLIVLESDSYKKGHIYKNFVIPYESELVIVKANKKMLIKK